MSWLWDQSTGTLCRNGAIVSRGYSGNGRGKNNPLLQGVRGIGPIPKGEWRIGKPYNSTNVGPYALPLFAVDGNTDDIHGPTGRSAFRIHGDSIRSPGTASKGCIILPRKVRELIYNSGDHILTVTE
jgi:hypothetical protein